MSESKIYCGKCDSYKSESYKCQKCKWGESVITNEDCMDLMARYPDNHFDLAIVDPPYGINKDGQRKEVYKGKKSKHNKKHYEYKGWDKQAPNEDYFNELLRVSKNQIIFGANYYPHHLKPSSCWIFWDKGQKLDQADGELAYCSIQKPVRSVVYNRVKISEKGGSIHPTQKPFSLYKWLLINYAEQGQSILDTHLGSGSIAIAVDSVNKIEKMNLTLTACEIDKEYYDAAMKRITEQTAWQSIF